MEETRADAVPLFPLSNTVMLPPSLPPTSLPSYVGSPVSSSSSRKRRRLAVDNDDASTVTSSPTRAGSNATSDFSLSAKRTIQQHCTAGRCWHCNASPAQACHVIARKDDSFPYLASRGLLNIQDLGDASNGVSLCPTCHHNFDKSRPGFVFFPSDLQYFIDFEKQDFIRRKQLSHRQHQASKRIVPSAEDYGAQQAQQHTDVNIYTLYGQYRRFVLKDYMPRPPTSCSSDIDAFPRIGELYLPALWHGDPLASLSRAFAVASEPISILPRDVCDLLHELSVLYKEHDEQIDSGETAILENDYESSPTLIVHAGSHNQPRHAPTPPFHRTRPSRGDKSRSERQSNTSAANAHFTTQRTHQQPSPPASVSSKLSKIPQKRSSTHMYLTNLDYNNTKSLKQSALHCQQTHPQQYLGRPCQKRRLSNSTINDHDETHLPTTKHRWKWGAQTTAQDMVRFYTEVRAIESVKAKHDKKM